VVVRDVEPRRQLGVVRVVADDAGDVDGELTGAPPGERVLEAVGLPGRQDGEAGRGRSSVNRNDQCIP